MGRIRDADAIETHLPLKPLDFSVLLVLSEGDDYGYGIVKRIARRESGGIRLAPSNLYYVLDRMVGAGLVEELPPEAQEAGEDADERRRYYRITALGRSVAAAEAHRLTAVLETAKRARLVARGEA
jgi:DNA-binding PadR family transcriptional regulator